VVGHGFVVVVDAVALCVVQPLPLPLLLLAHVSIHTRPHPI
jgi:hypothetical protein